MSTVEAKNDIADSSGPPPGRQPTTQRGGPLDVATMQRNPLRLAADRRLPRVPEPCALVVFGVTGDLSRKKLLPAIYDLANRGLLPTDFVLLGFARRDWGDGDFEDLAKKSAKQHARTPWSDEVWNRLSGRVKFVPGAWEPESNRPMAVESVTLWLLPQRNSHSTLTGVWFLPVESGTPCDCGA